MSKICNAKIINISFSMKGIDCFDFEIKVNDGIQDYIIYGGTLGHNVGSIYHASGAGVVALMKLMNTVGVDSLNDLKDKYIRIEVPENPRGFVSKVGNILEDKWLDFKDFFNKEKVINAQEFTLEE